MIFEKAHLPRTEPLAISFLKNNLSFSGAKTWKKSRFFQFYQRWETVFQTTQFLDLQMWISKGKSLIFGTPDVNFVNCPWNDSFVFCPWDFWISQKFLDFSKIPWDFWISQKFHCSNSQKYVFSLKREFRFFSLRFPGFPTTNGRRTGTFFSCDSALTPTLKLISQVTRTFSKWHRVPTVI